MSITIAVPTYIVQVNVDTTEVVQHEVSNRVGALDGVGVAVERLEKPWVLVGNELACRLISPKLVPLAPSFVRRPIVYLPCTRSQDASQCSFAVVPSSARECSR